MSEQSKHKQDEAIASISIQRDDNADGAYVGQVRAKRISAAGRTQH